MIRLNLYRLSDEVQLPKYGTPLSSCFDLHYCAIKSTVDGYDKHNNPIVLSIDKNKALYITPGDRVLVPTGIVMKLTKALTIETYNDLYDDKKLIRQLSIRLHARSGLALKRGLVLANAEGIIDADYQQQVFVLITNISSHGALIEHQERIAQAEVVLNEEIMMTPVDEMPTQHSSRDGGFGSTGTGVIKKEVESVKEFNGYITDAS